jgi:hypothetical protein
VTELGKQPLSDFLAAVAAATPAPGGGTSCGVAAALAAALVEMSAGLGGRPDDAGRAGELRLRALELAEEELTSYAPVLEARTPDERSAALVAASEPPCRIVEVAADVAELGVSVAGSASALRGGRGGSTPRGDQPGLRRRGRTRPRGGGAGRDGSRRRRLSRTVSTFTAIYAANVETIH